MDPVRRKVRVTDVPRLRMWLMRISELSRRSDVSVASIKFYLREGLLNPGRMGSGRHAEYGDEHLSRIRLIKTMTDLGRMSISAVRETLEAIDDCGLETRGLCNVVNDALFTEPAGVQSLPHEQGAQQRIDAFIGNLGWRVERESASRQTLAQVFTALQRLSGDADVHALIPYANAAARLAALEMEAMPRTNSTGEAARAVAQAVLLEVALTSLRRMAREHMVASLAAEPS